MHKVQILIALLVYCSVSKLQIRKMIQAVSGVIRHGSLAAALYTLHFTLCIFLGLKLQCNTQDCVTACPVLSILWALDSKSQKMHLA